MVRATYSVQMSFDAFVGPSGRIVPNTWTTVTDVVRAEGIQIRRGMTDQFARVSGPGTASFVLRNDAGNSGAKLGYYSPGNSNCRTGFGYGTWARVVAVYSAVAYILFTGRIRVIDPTPGTYRNRHVQILAVDNIGEWVDARLVNIAIQINQSSLGLMSAIYLAVPDAVRPETFAQNGASTDVFPYAFDDLGEGPGVMSAVNRAIVSGFDKLYVDTGNDLIQNTRNYLSALTSSHDFVESELMDLSVPSDLSGVYNRVRVTVHPKRIGSSTITLFSQNDVVSVGPGQSLVVWGTIRDASTTTQLIGAYSSVAPVASTDYAANAAANGTGTDITTSVSVTAAVWASTVRFTITNSSGLTAYLVTGAGAALLQVRGVGIYDDGPLTAESHVTDTAVGDQTYELDMPYQNNPNVAQDLADYLRTGYGSLAKQVTALMFIAEKSDTLMLTALQTDITSVITVTETVTGASSVRCAIQAIEWEINERAIAQVTYRLAPWESQRAWILDSSSYSQLDSTTILGFAA